MQLLTKSFIKIILIGFFTIQSNINVFAETSETSSDTTYINSTLVDFTSSDLPIIIIKTNGKQILDSVKIIADMGIINNGNGNRNYLTSFYNDYNGKIAIEYRGSTSLNFPKKPYGFETVGDDGNSADVSLLGMPAENDWVLYPPYSDKSLIRDALLYSLSNKIGRYATRTVYCELVLNGEYLGIYVLMEKVKRNKNRVNIAKVDSLDISGGYIIKLDKLTGDDNGGWNSKYPVNPKNVPKLFFQYHYPKPSDIKPEQELYIQQFIEQFEKTLSSSGYTDTSTGYSKYIDVDSFVDHFLLTEICKNVDGYRLSTYLYKDSDSKNGKLAMGPVWDYNLAFGNCDYDNGQYTYGWQLDWPNDPYHNQIPFWWVRLLMDKKFSGKVYQRWTELRKEQFSFDAISGTIDSLAAILNESKVRNFSKWNILGRYVWPNYFIGKTHESEIEYLKSWIQKRLVWMDTNIFGKPATSSVAQEKTTEESYVLYQNYPNPFNPETMITYQLSKDSEVKLKVYNQLGQEIKTLTDQYQSAGIYHVNFNSASLSSGNYFYVLESGKSRAVRMMTLIK